MNKVIFCYQSAINIEVYVLQQEEHLNVSKWYKVSPLYMPAIEDVCTSKQDLLLSSALFHLNAVENLYIQKGSFSGNKEHIDI